MTPVTMPIKKIVLVFQVLILGMIVASCNKRQQEHKTIFIDNMGVYYEQIETMHGAVKEIIKGDSVKADNFEHFYFNRTGCMVKENAKYISGNDTMSRKTDYSTIFDKTGKKLLVKAFYRNYPDSCGCNGEIRWKFDSKEQVIEKISSQVRFDSFVEYKYDSTGRIRYKNVWGKKVSPDRYYYKYDDENHLVEIAAYEMGVNEKDATSALSSTSFKYIDFDSCNNWTKMVQGIDTITRKITYY